MLCSSSTVFAVNQAACWAPLWMPPATAATLALFPLIGVIQNPQNIDNAAIFAASGAAIGLVSAIIWGLTDCYLERDPPQYLVPTTSTQIPRDENTAEDTPILVTPEDTQ